MDPEGLMKSLFLSSCLSFVLITPGFSRDAPKKIVELPLFEALSGERKESGILIPKAGANPLQGEAKSIGQPAIAGLWYQLDGHAKYGPVEWIYRWMFVFSDSANMKVRARYIDTMGQVIDYEGLYDVESNRVQLIGKMKDGTAKFQMALEEGGSVSIQSVLEDAGGKPAVTYSGQSEAAE